MKVRDSGMPDEKIWNSFFNIDLILEELEINEQIHSQINSQSVNLVEIGCGYGTFTLPIAKLISGKLYSYDYEAEMIEYVNQKILSTKSENLDNIILKQRDILELGIDLEDNSIDCVCLFNILHCQHPEIFLAEAHRVLKQNGKIAIIHWRCDIKTPRGPDMSIRPDANQIKSIIDKSLLRVHKDEMIFEPFHWGIILAKR